MQAIWFLCPAHQNGLGSTAEDRHDSSTRQQTADETTDDSNENHHLGGGSNFSSPSCNLWNILNREPNSLGWFYQWFYHWFHMEFYLVFKNDIPIIPWFPSGLPTAGAHLPRQGGMVELTLGAPSNGSTDAKANQAAQQGS